MGNQLTTAIGDTMTCFRDHENQAAVGRGVALGSGRDLDDAVLAATSNAIDGANHLSQILRLTFACKKLPNLDTFTRTDGMAVLYEKRGNMWQQLGMTEVIMDNLDPEWVKCFDVPYKFEEQQLFKVIVYDIDDFQNLKAWDKHDLVGELEFTLHEVVTAKDQILIKPISATKRDAQIEIVGEEIQGGGDHEQAILAPILTFADTGQRGQMLFFIMYRMHVPENMPGRGNHVWKPVYKSELKSSNNNRNVAQFEFNQFSLLVQDLCGGDRDKEVKVEFFQSSKNGRHKNLGSVLFTVNEVRGDANVELQLVKQKNAKLTFSKLIFQKRNSFLEYIFGGCELNLAIAIDFTLSNGKPTDRDSLHNLNLNRNEYYKALYSVGKILEFYDTDKQFPVFGFGARLNLGCRLFDSHCFALNGNICNPECDGLDGVLSSYKKALNNVDLYGPTHFNQIIKLVNDMAEGANVSQHNQKYQILLILTDGIINDMKQTIDEIVRGSALPMSIIIVGVGDADFTSMDVLDADDEPLYSQKYKKYMSSDIVQFVPFSEFKNDPRLLAKEVLEEIPRQFLYYMERHGIKPKSVHEAEKRKIRAQLSRKGSMKSQGEAEAPEFFVELEEKFINECTEMGYDYTDVKDFIEDKGLPVLSHDLLTDCLKQRNYRNPLYSKPQEQPVQFGYFDPAQNPGGMQQPPQGYYSQAPMGGQPFNPKAAPRQANTMFNQPPAGMPAHLQQQQSQDNMQQDEDRELCKVCLVTHIDTVCVPCGHRSMCHECSKDIMASKNKTCIMCRQRIQQIVKTFDT